MCKLTLVLRVCVTTAVHFKDKKWDSVFVVIVALMIIDWTLCYGLKL